MQPNQDRKRTINKNSTPQDIEAYSRLYVRHVRRDDEDACFIGSLPELCGDCCHGDTAAEVYTQLDDIAPGYAEDKARGRLCPAAANCRETPGGSAERSNRASTF